MISSVDSSYSSLLTWNGGSWRKALFTITLGFIFAFIAINFSKSLTPFSLILAGASVVFAIYYYPLLGLILALVFSGTSRIFVFIPDIFTFSKLFALLGLLAYIAKPTLIRDFRLIKTSKTLIAYCTPAIWFLITMPFSIASVDQIFTRIFNILAIILFVYVICAIPRNIKQLTTALFLMVVGSFLIGIWVIFFSASGLGEGLFVKVGKISLYYDHDFAIQLGLTICLSWILFRKSSIVLRGILLLCDAGLLICILFTNSRTTWIALIASIIFPILWLGFNGYFKKSVKILLLIGTFFIVCFFVFKSTTFYNDLTTTFNSRAESLINLSSHELRITDIWPNAIKFILNHPLFGGGIGSSGGAHNAFLENGAEGGLFGIFFYIFSLLTAFYYSSRATNFYVKMFGISLFSFVLIVSQTNPSTFYSIPYGFAMGLISWLETHPHESFLVTKHKISH